MEWSVIDKYFADNPNNLVAHHLESYNDFFNQGIYRIFKENNPIRFIEREDEDDQRNECLLYMGGKDGKALHFGKPIIYDDGKSQFMYPNDARIRNMTYGITIHYDVDVDFVYYVGDTRRTETRTYTNIYLGRFPIMLQSDLCILKSLNKEVRFHMGECRNDYGGYFIIDGLEKVIVSQETFADNMMYTRVNKADNDFSHSCEVRSVSEDASKPMRTTSVKIVAESSKFSNKQIVVSVPNVKKPVPLFILMRALGLTSDKEIIQTCLLDLETNQRMIDLFIPSVHDANRIFNQETALKYIASFTKSSTVSGTMEILSNYFIPHIGELNFLEKAFYIGYMTHRLLKVYLKEEAATDRDSFRFKRVELSGSLIYDLFREYYLIQKKTIAKNIDEEYYYHKGEYVATDLEPNDLNKYKNNFVGLVDNNVNAIFKTREVETGFRKAFKGDWGSLIQTKRVGVVQDLNRLSWNTFISHLRKLNLPLDASAKVVGPRHLNGSQYGFIDPLDTPDGGNIGLHKHLAISTFVTSGSSAAPLITWLKKHTPLKGLFSSSTDILYKMTKMIVNGRWIGVVDMPIELVDTLRLYRRNGIIPVYTSISFDYERNEIFMYTDAGRLTRPLYYRDDKFITSFSKHVDALDKGLLSWEQIVAGTRDKKDAVFHSKKSVLYEPKQLYGEQESLPFLLEGKSVVDYLDTAEEESSLIAIKEEELTKSSKHTHLEIDPSLMLGVMGNQIIYPENNPFARNSFSCGQSKQAVSVYHSNFQARFDKFSVVLNYGQVPLIKSRYLEHINKEEQPYGVNAIVAIMTYTGYNVEDAILFNKGAIDRGIFRTTYLSVYEGREESATISNGSMSKFANIQKNPVQRLKPGYDYSQLDDDGLIRENTELNDKVVVIGKIASTGDNVWTDESVKPKKGQLGFVDKVFMTQGEEGFNIAKVRVREDRAPAMGDKMASRAGQKGTIGLILSEEDMPFTADGIKPDLIINPHALPSRMTIGQIVESLFGKVCTSYGGFGDCTAFQMRGSNASETYAPLLVRAGFHSSGNQLLYNGMTGEQLEANIYIGPTYYMRLKHMVKDKINYRARGPNTALERQPVQGRANDGGLRIGEMERDGVLAHGMSYFLNESFMTRADEYLLAICNTTGAIAIYNEANNLFLSPYADGPIKFHTNPDGTMHLKNVSRYGRSFSIIKIPYTFKLLIQELLTMNIQMRIITEDTIDQHLSMSYSDNINKLLNDKEDNLDLLLRKYLTTLRNVGRVMRREEPLDDSPPPPVYAPQSPAYPQSPTYAPETPPPKEESIVDRVTNIYNNATSAVTLDDFIGTTSTTDFKAPPLFVPNILDVEPKEEIVSEPEESNVKKVVINIKP